MARSAVDKRDNTRPPEVHRLTESKGANFPAGLMLIASPLEVRAIIDRIPVGCVMTMAALREYLARMWAADYTCPITTGIFVRIVAEAAEEESSDTPYWRVVRPDGRLIDKLPGGEIAQAKRLRAEGVACVAVGKNGRKVQSLAPHAWTPFSST